VVFPFCKERKHTIKPGSPKPPDKKKTTNAIFQKARSYWGEKNVMKKRKFTAANKDTAGSNGLESKKHVELGKRQT